MLRLGGSCSLELKEVRNQQVLGSIPERRLQPPPVTWRERDLEDSANLPDPQVIAEEIAEDLLDALEQIEGVLTDLKARAWK